MQARTWAVEIIRSDRARTKEFLVKIQLGHYYRKNIFISPKKNLPVHSLLLVKSMPSIRFDDSSPWSRRAAVTWRKKNQFVVQALIRSAIQKQKHAKKKEAKSITIFGLFISDLVVFIHLIERLVVVRYVRVLLGQHRPPVVLAAAAVSRLVHRRSVHLTTVTTTAE